MFQTVGCHCYDTAVGLELFEPIRVKQAHLSNHIAAHRNSSQKVWAGAEISKKYDGPATPF